jgi:hypothetical protein
MSPPPRRKLLVAKVGIATITYTLLASPIACNLPAPPPNPEPTDARPESTTGVQPKTPGTTPDSSAH